VILADDYMLLTTECIELGFHWILKDILKIKKSCGIQSKLL